MAKKELNKEELEKELKKVSEIASREPSEYDTFKKVYKSTEWSPYIIPASWFLNFVDDPPNDEVTRFTTYDRRRSDAEMVALKTLNAVKKGAYYTFGGIMGGTFALLAGAISTPIEVPRLIIQGIKAKVNKNNNRRIEKAKIRQLEITEKLKTLTDEEQQPGDQ